MGIIYTCSFTSYFSNQQVDPFALLPLGQKKFDERSQSQITHAGYDFYKSRHCKIEIDTESSVNFVCRNLSILTVILIRCTGLSWKIHFLLEKKRRFVP